MTQFTLQTQGSSKYVALPFVIGLMALIYRIYKNRKEKVYAKYASLEDVNGTANSLIVFFVIVVPFFLAIYFLNN